MRQNLFDMPQKYIKLRKKTKKFGFLKENSLINWHYKCDANVNKKHLECLQTMNNSVHYSYLRQVLSRFGEVPHARSFNKRQIPEGSIQTRSIQNPHFFSVWKNGKTRGQMHANRCHYDRRPFSFQLLSQYDRRRGISPFRTSWTLRQDRTSDLS